MSEEQKGSEAIATVPWCAYEAMVTRYKSVIRWVAGGWAVSMVAMAAAILWVCWG